MEDQTSGLESRISPARIVAQYTQAADTRLLRCSQESSCKIQGRDNSRSRDGAIVLSLILIPAAPMYGSISGWILESQVVNAKIDFMCGTGHWQRFPASLSTLISDYPLLSVTPQCLRRSKWS